MGFCVLKMSSQVPPFFSLFFILCPSKHTLPVLMLYCVVLHVWRIIINRYVVLGFVDKAMMVDGLLYR